MNHHTYNTEAIVLSSSAVGEADRTVWLLTRELGLLVVRARSARKEKSKMRYALQNYSVCIVSLVRGKAIWRVTGAVLKYTFYTDLKNTDTLHIATKVSNLIERFVPREEDNEVLFEILSKGLQNLIQEKENTAISEILLVAQILNELGYLPDEVAIKEKNEKKLLKDINEAILHAGL